MITSTPCARLYVGISCVACGINSVTRLSIFVLIPVATDMIWVGMESESDHSYLDMTLHLVVLKFKMK